MSTFGRVVEPMNTMLLGDEGACAHAARQATGADLITGKKAVERLEQK